MLDFTKKKDILSKISAEMPHIILEFLPAYSPDYNLLNWPGIQRKNI